MTIGHVYPLSNIAKAQKSTYNGSGNPLPDDLIRVGSEGRWPSIPEVTKHKKAFVEGKATKELQQPVRELIAYFEGMRSESPYPPIRLVKVEHPPLQYADKISINNTPQKNKDPVDPSRLPEPNSTQSNSTQPNNGRVSSLLPQSSPCLQLQPIPQSSQVRESVESNGQSGDGALAVQNVKGTGIGETPLSRTSSVDSGYEADKKDTGNNMPTAMEVRNSIMKARKSDRLQQAEKAEEAEKVECAGLVTKMKQVTTGAKELLSSRTNLDPSSSYGTFIQREVESEVDRVILLAEKASKAANSGDLKVAQALAKTAEDNLKLLAEKLPAIDSFMQEVDAFQQDIIGDFSKQKPDIEEAERHTYPLLYKRIMDMGEEFIDAAEALKQEGTVNLRVAEKRFETIKDSYEKAKKAKENEKGNYAEFVGKVKKIENKIKGIQPNSEEGWEIKDKANGYVWKALTEMHSCNLKVANLHVEQAEAHLKSLEEDQDDRKAVAADHEELTVAQASPKANQAERDKLVEQMELIKAQAEDTCKSNPDPSIKRQCDGIITLAGKASEAAKGETKITVVRNYARSAERRLDAFVKQQSAVKAERALVKEMEDHIEKMKNFRLENEKINPSIKSYISEVILAAQSALRGARTRTATKFYQQAKSLIYIMENVKGEEKSIDDTQKAIVAEVRDYRTKFITVLSPLAKEEVESNIGKIKIFLNKGSKEKKAIVEALLSKDIAGAKKHLETLKEYRSNFFKCLEEIARHNNTARNAITVSSDSTDK